MTATNLATLQAGDVVEWRRPKQKPQSGLTGKVVSNTLNHVQVHWDEIPMADSFFEKSKPNTYKRLRLVE